MIAFPIKKYNNIEVVHGDCKDVCKNFPKFDHLITDPPYEISRENNFDTHPKGGKGMFYGDWDVDVDYTSWINIIAPLIKQTVIFFSSVQNISFLIKDFEKNDFIYKRPITIRKLNPVPFNMNRLPSSHVEIGAWMVRNNTKWTFNNEGNQIILDFCVATSRGEFHPNQKNPRMMSKLIKTFTSRGDSILDPFAGSGQTLIEAHKLDRKSTGVELEEKFYNTINKRINNELNLINLPKYSFI